MKVANIVFPEYTGLRCLMMPYTQGDHRSVPEKFFPYADILDQIYVKRGDIGFLTIDESPVLKGKPHRGDRAKTNRAIHTEAGRLPGDVYNWGGGGFWGGRVNVTLDKDVQILLANNLNDSCAVWEAWHEDTSEDGDIGYASADYPYETATFMDAGAVHQIGIFTPHESVPVQQDYRRQFLRIVSSGVHGREPYFTENPLVAFA